MIDNISPSRLISFIHRHAVGALLLCYAGVIACATLAPFEFHLDAIPQSLANLLKSLQQSPIKTRDIIGNMVLYVPLGALAWTWCRQFGRGALFSSIMPLLGAMFLSATTEFLQLAVPIRVTSLADVAANVMGCAIGLVIGPATHRHYLNIRRAMRTELAQRPLLTIATMLSSLLLVLYLYPFDVALDRPQMRRIVTQLGLDPTTRYDTLQFVPDFGVPVDVTFVSLWIARNQSDYLLGLCAEAAGYALLSGLMLAALRRELEFTLRSAFGLAVWSTIIVATVVSLIRTVLASHGPDIAHLLVAIVASILGAISGGVALSAWHNSRRSSDRGARQQIKKAASAAMLLLALFALARETVPLTWERYPVVLAPSEYTTFHLRPLALHVGGPAHTAALDVGGKLLRFAILGAALEWFLRAKDVKNRTRKIALIAACFSLTAQIVHLWMPVRHSDLTNVLLAVMGASLGGIVHQWLRDAYRYSIMKSKVQTRGAKLLQRYERRRLRRAPPITSDQAVVQAIIDSGPLPGSPHQTSPETPPTTTGDTGQKHSSRGQTRGTDSNTDEDA